MTRTHLALLLVIGAELAVGGFLAARRRDRPTFPVPDYRFVDETTADDLRAASRADNRSPEAWAELGLRYLGTGYLSEAEACFRIAADRKPREPRALFEHGFALERIGRVAEANTRYREAIQAGHARGPELWYYVGRNALRLEDPDAAAEAFSTAGDLQLARYELARLHVRSGNVAEAAAELRNLADSYPATQQPVTLQYRIALAANDRSLADRLADRFDRQTGRLANPFDIEYRWVETVRDSTGLRGRSRQAIRAAESGRTAEAEAALREVLAIEWSSEAVDQLAEVCLKLGRPADSIRLLEEANERDGPSFNLTWRLADAYQAAGRPSDARREWERAARLGTGPELKELQVRLADVYERAGDSTRAKAARVAALTAAGVGAIEAGNPREAYEYLTGATQLDPSQAVAWYWLGEALRIGGGPGARQAYERCLELDPNHGRAARVLQVLGP